MPSILNYSAKIAIPCSRYHYYEPLSLTVQSTLYIIYEWRMVIVTKLYLHPRSEKFTAIRTIDENFLNGPIGCHSVYT